MRNFQQVRTRKSLAASGFFALAAACAAASPAGAASSAWHAEDGGSIRLLTAGGPDAAGGLRGALEIVLKPGWKTYWRDPGIAGVPPSIDVRKSDNVSSAHLDFPAPQRHDDGYGAWAGYAASVALPVTFAVPDTAKPTRIDANVFLGLCRDICVPVSARLTVNPDTGDTPDEQALIQAAYAALPKSATKEFGVEVSSVEASRLLLTANLPESRSETPQLFLAGENGFVFSAPVPEKTAEGWRFAVPLLERPAGSNAPPVFYTLSLGRDAVSGTFGVP